MEGAPWRGISILLIVIVSPSIPYGCNPRRLGPPAATPLNARRQRDAMTEHVEDRPLPLRGFRVISPTHQGNFRREQVLYRKVIGTHSFSIALISRGDVLK